MKVLKAISSFDCCALCKGFIVKTTNTNPKTINQNLFSTTSVSSLFCYKTHTSMVKAL